MFFKFFFAVIFFVLSFCASVWADDIAIFKMPDPTWRPRPEAEITLVAKMQSEAKVHFRFTLLNVSNYPGIASNFAENTNFDLEFKKGQKQLSKPKKTSDGYVIETLSPQNEVAVTIVAHDGAAWGRIKAEAKIKYQWVPCLTEYTTSLSYTLPVDKNENKIADIWERMYHTEDLPIDSDEDNLPESNYKGDNLTLFDEYRGFFTSTGWISTNPWEKDLFIHNPNNFDLGYFNKLNLQIHFIDKDQYINNFERTLNHLNQSPTKAYGIWLSDAPKRSTQKDNGHFWYAKNLPNLSGTPKDIERVIINKHLITAHKIIAERLKEKSGFSPQKQEIDSNWIIAHQLSQAVGLTKHGANLSSKNCPFYGCLSAQRNGATSGLEDSIMRLHFATHYLGEDGKWYIYPYYDTNGTEFCNTEIPLANGINSAPQRYDESNRLLPIANNSNSKTSCISALRLTDTTEKEKNTTTIKDIKRIYQQKLFGD